MRRTLLTGSVRAAGLAVTGLAIALVCAAAASAGSAASVRPASAGSGPSASPITQVSQGCAGQNAEVEQAIDPARGYVYEEWMGCHNSIGFARSTDGGVHFSPPVILPQSTGAWDPAVTVAPDGTVYAAFMNSTQHHTFPVVEASFDHGRTFPQVTAVVAKQKDNWGDREFLAVGPDGSVYLTWDYGPSAKAVTYICSKGGSCAFATGDLNVVMQKSADGGKTWGPMVHVSPGFPASGGDSGPLIVEPSGRIDVLYQGYHITSKTKFTMTPAHSYFTSSSDGGQTWSAPVRLGPPALTMSLAEWWIDGAIGRDAAGNLYATWDTQAPGQDIGWLSYSTDGGRTWSALQRVTPDTGHATHIVEVAGGPPGLAYVGWLTDNSAPGYAQYVRTFSIKRGWLSAPVRVSVKFGNRAVWPGDTFGISAFPRGPNSGLTGVPDGSQRVVLSWGSAVARQKKPNSEIFATALTYRG